jgi:hypothetical protein
LLLRIRRLPLRFSRASFGAYITLGERAKKGVSLTRKHLLLGFGVACLLGILTAPASAKDCAAWNNWCRPACGDWNGYCAGQSLPQVISRMSPRSYFADPWWYGHRSDALYQEPRWPGKAPKTQVRKGKSLRANAASSR